MQKSSTSPDAYIWNLPDNIKKDVDTLDKAIVKAMTGEDRVLWQGKFWGGSEQNIIGYGDYVYKRPKGDIEWFIVGLATQKNYISVYVNAVEDNKYLVEKYVSKLGKVKAGKSNISFKKLSDVNLDELIELVKKAKDIMRQDG